MSLEERSAARRQRIVATVSHGFEEAERWDLEYWQQRTPAQRLAALVAIRRDVRKVMEARERAGLDRG